MPTKKNKFRDLKPTKDAKGGGGGKTHYVQGGGSVEGGQGTTQGGGATDGPALRGKIATDISK